MSETLYETLYEQIRQRFTSKLTCGPEKDEPWWDWLALKLKDAEAERAALRAEVEQWKASDNEVRAIFRLERERAKRAEETLRWCDEFAPGIVAAAHAALRTPAPAESPRGTCPGRGAIRGAHIIPAGSTVCTECERDMAAPPRAQPPRVHGVGGFACNCEHPERHCAGTTDRKHQFRAGKCFCGALEPRAQPPICFVREGLSILGLLLASALLAGCSGNLPPNVDPGHAICLATCKGTCVLQDGPMLKTWVCVPATCADGLPPGPAGCPKTCADLACQYGCDEHPSGAVCKPAPPPAECLPGVPWCNDVYPPATCSTTTQPCKHNPTTDPKHCELAPACVPGDPCTGVLCPEGQHCVVGVCAPDVPPDFGEDCDGAPLILSPEQRLASHGSVVNKVLQQETGCEIGSECLLGNETTQHFMRRVIEHVRVSGLCAGQHDPGVSDEIAVATDQRAVREGYKITAGDDGPDVPPPGAAPRKVVWVPQAVRRAWLAPTTPPGASCPAPQPDRSPEHLVLELERRGNWLDATVHTQATLPYCQAIGMGEMGGQPRAACPMRPEGDPNRMPCELWALGGDYRWEPFPSWGVIERNDQNPAQARCTGCDKIRVCSLDESVCSPWETP